MPEKRPLNCNPSAFGLQQVDCAQSILTTLTSMAEKTRELFGDDYNQAVGPYAGRMVKEMVIRKKSLLALLPWLLAEAQDDGERGILMCAAYELIIGNLSREGLPPNFIRRTTTAP